MQQAAFISQLFLFVVIWGGVCVNLRENKEAM
jgi:hypothetical protein